MPSKFQAVNFGKEIVQTSLACNAESLIQEQQREWQKHFVKSYLTVFFAVDLYKDFENVLKYSKEDLFNELIKVIQLIRSRIIVADERDEKLNEYFFLSALLYMLNIIVKVIIAGMVFDQWHIKISCVLYNRAKAISAELGIASPDINFASTEINFEKSMVAEIDTFHQVVIKWIDDLQQNAKGNNDNTQDNWQQFSKLPKN
jgi:hypothetical protein